MAAPPNPPPSTPRRSTSATVILLGFVLLIALAAAIFSRRNAGPLPAEALDGDVSATEEATVDAGPALEGLSGTIIFMSDRDGDWDVYTLDLASGALTNLTRNRAEDGFASYSLDGEQISFLSDEGRADGAQLGGFLMNPDGTGRAQAAADLATFMSIVMNGRGDWDVRGLGTSPEGTSSGDEPLVIVSLRDLNMEVYVRQGGEDRNVSRSPAIDWYASWSPDGERVVFASDREGGQHDLYIARAAEGAPAADAFRRLTDDPQDDWSPVFTRDGRYILFASERDGLMQGGAIGLYAIDWTAAQSDASTLPTAVPVESLTDPADAALDSGAVTQSGVTVFMSRRDGNWELYGETSAGVVNLTQDAGNDLFPLWMPATP